MHLLNNNYIVIIYAYARIGLLSIDSLSLSLCIIYNSQHTNLSLFL